MSENKLYPDVEPNPDFARIEEKILKFWQEDGTFEKSVQNRPAKINGKNNEYIFYDGPPFANGLPHYGHLLTGFVKDMFARFQTMKGRRVERRFGWDCHGLPAEMGAEKELGISGRQQITGYGIEKFNDYCQTSVMKYASEWEYYVTRQGRWVDFKNDYKTMDKTFMESVMWAFKQLYDKGLIYEAYRVVPYSWAAETPLSNFETHLDNSYRMRQDPAVTVAFELDKVASDKWPVASKYYLLAWTTTPWTLPSNLALAVKADMGYSSTFHDGKCYIHGASYTKAIQKTLYGDKCVIETPRLIMREFTKDDFHLFAALSADAEVNALLKTVTDEAECKKMFDTVLSDYKKYGFSKWAVFEKESGEFVGRAGVNRIPGVEDVVEVGYVLHKKFWGKGYATEIAKASYDYAFANLGLEEVSSLCHADNAPSRKVMQKFGLRPNGKLFYPWLGDERERHTITRDEYFAANGMLGKNLVGASYQPLFPYFKNHPNAFRVLEGDFIEEGQGTGVVHMAPGFGEDDQRVCEAAGIKLVVPVDHAGKFTDEIFDLPESRVESRESSGKDRLLDSSHATLATSRLYLRPFIEDDFPDFLSMQRDPEVAKTTSDGLLPEEKVRAEFDRFMADHKKYGYSQWAVIEKESGKFVGRAGLDERDFIQFIEGSLGKVSELRYCFKSEFWGKGYATELTPVILDWAFNIKGFDNIIAGNNPTYARSINVLTRYGFERQKTVQYKNQPVDFRVLKREKFLESRVESRESSEKKKILDSSHSTLATLSLKGRNVLECNKDIIAWLKASGNLIKQETIDHSYPHCWRTDQPLIYKAVPSWYVEVTKFRHRMVELNKQINWIPGHVKEGLFGKWIENARDWSISRNRFWGAPIPIWKSDNPENKKLYVFGSIKELEEFFGVKVENLHRPYIDNLTKADPDNPKFTLRRVEDVLDCWFESGSMPYGQVHYPFENGDLLENGHFPADFIVEYQAQTRGWFYTLMVLSTALFDKPPFKNCICHGVVLDDKGQKLSKRLNNYADPKWLFDTYGADALRWFMMSSPVMRGAEMYIDKEGKFIRDSVRLYIKPFWNAYSFFTLYANADGVKAEYSFDSINIMDKYILTKLHYVVQQVDDALEKYDTVSACNSIAAFFEVLNNWYIRRSKERFWKDEKDSDKQSAYNTLYTVLHVMCRVAAPLLPMVTEEIFSGLAFAQWPVASGQWPENKSVHLADYPYDVRQKVKPDSKLESEMDLVRDICNSAHFIRSTQNIRVRQPLGKIRLAGKKLNPDFTALVLDEVNAKAFEHADEKEFGKLATFKLQLNMKKLGAKLGQQFKTVLAASKSGDWKKLDGGLIEVAGVKLEADEFDLKLVPSDEKTSAALSNNDAVVILDTTITPELEKEGIARDLVRMIQQARKDAKLDVSDKINLSIDGPQNVIYAYQEHKGYIASQTLSSTTEVAVTKGFDFKFENDFDGEKVVIALSKAA